MNERDEWVVKGLPAVALLVAIVVAVLGVSCLAGIVIGRFM